jgi:hypothetical protein
MRIELKKCIYTLQFANNQAIISNDKDDIENMIRKLIGEYKR